MFGKRLKIFTLLGFEVRIDLSWFFIALFITWSLSEGLFPYFYKNLTTQTYWFMGIAGTLGLFLSVVIHEFAHSLVARRYGMDMKGITLFIFGGVAEMGDEPSSPKVEFLMAIAGPFTSIVLSLFFLALAHWTRNFGEPVFGVLRIFMGDQRHLSRLQSGAGLSPGRGQDSALHPLGHQGRSQVGYPHLCQYRLFFCNCLNRPGLYTSCPG